MKKEFIPYAYLPSLMTEEEIDLGLIQLHPLDAKYKKILEAGAQVDLSNKIDANHFHGLLEDSLYLLAFIHSLPGKVEPAPFFYYGNLDSTSMLAQASPIHLPAIPDALYKAAGDILENLYTAKQPDPLFVRMMRAIRFYMDSRLSVIRNVEGEGEESQAEKLLFLSLSLETLFHLKHSKASSELKQVLRGLLDLRYGRTVELMWKWCEGFFSGIDAIISCESEGDRLFSENPNYHELYGEIARKIFYLSVSGVFVDKLGVEAALFAKWGIHRSGVVCHFWSEEELLHKIVILLMQVAHEAWNEEIMDEIKELSSLWAYMRSQNHFLPTDSNVLKGKVERLSVLLRLIEEKPALYDVLKRHFHPRLMEELQILA